MSLWVEILRGVGSVTGTEEVDRVRLGILGILILGWEDAGQSGSLRRK